ncbi:MAG: FtsX-like permease family protein [Spirochaetales bacterium]|nr:FtsX-like permease family protein [Spirochaetales bacterium]
MIHLFLTSWRNFLRNLRRYWVLLLALILVTAVLTSVLAVFGGMRTGINEKASRYFAGDLVVFGYTGHNKSIVEHPQEVLEAVDEVHEQGIGIKAISKRSIYYKAARIDLFYAGYWTRQRRLLGAEWALERPMLENLSFTAGGVPEDGDESAAMISRTTADQLKIEVGDTMLVSIWSDKERVNTTEVVIRGIFEEPSFFGFATYLHRKTLNRLREVPEHQINELGVYLEKPLHQQQKAARLLAQEMDKRLPTIGVLDREAYRAAPFKKREVREYGVTTLSAQLDELNDLLQVLTIISVVIMIMFLGITVVGVSNTFTMIVWERTREIGTLRALGLQKGGVILSFLFEALFLGIGGVVFGILFGVVILFLVQMLVELPPNFVSTLFFSQGRLQWVLAGRDLVLIASVVIGASILGSVRATIRAGRKRPVEALSKNT